MTAEEGSSAGGVSGAGGASTAGSALFTIEDTSRLEITSNIPEYDAVVLQVGMGAVLTTDAVNNEEWSGTVKSISPKATDDNGNFTVVVSVTSPVGELAIGMSAKVNVITNVRHNVYAVPYDAVTTGEAGERVVYMWAGEPASTQSVEAPVQEGGTVPAGRPVVVQTGMETDYYIEISGDGLEDGLQILVDPENKNVSAEGTSGIGGGFPFGGGGA